MSKLSQEIPEEIVAIELLKNLETEKDVRAFIKGEERDAVLDAAQNRINELLKTNPPKEGETGLITKLKNTFKGAGIQGEKSPSDEPITGDEVVDALDAAAEKKAEDIQKQSDATEAKAEQAAASVPKTSVTIDDVIAKMRSEGKKI